MNIAQVSDSFLPVVDGVGRVVESYARTLSEMGHAVTVLAPSNETVDMAALPYQVVTYGAFQMPGKLPYRVGVPQLDIRFEHTLREVPLDVVHVHSPFLLGRAAHAQARRRGVPVVSTFHSKFYDDFQQTLGSDLLARGGVRLVVDFFRQCDEVWAVSRESANTLHEYGYDGEIIVMPNGTDTRAVDPSVLPELRARFGLSADVPVLLYVGQLNWKKNILRILEGSRSLLDLGIGHHVLLVGQGPHAAEIDAAAASLGLGGRYTLTGHIGDTRTLDGLYALASLLVFPSRYDNAPMVVREAAQVGTPAVLLRASNAAEGIVDGENGYLCGDSGASVAEVVAAALADPAALVAAGEAARRTIPVPWPRLMAVVIRRYQGLLDARGTRG